MSSSKRKNTNSTDPGLYLGSQSELPAQDSEGPGPTARGNAKRQRVSRACDQCRSAREKCDGIQPLCFPCVSQNRHCTYQANPKKRGVQTGYIRTLELALAWVFEKVPGSEDALHALLAHEGGQGQRLLTGKESAAAHRLHRKWRKSKVHKGIDCILAGREVHSPPSPDVSPPSEAASDTDEEAYPLPDALDVRPSSSMDVPAPAPAPLHYQAASHIYGTDSKQPGQGPWRTDTGLFRASVTPSPITSHLRTPLSSFQALRLPANHWRLLDVYFAYTHCWLPILEKQEIFQASYLYTAEHGLDISVANPSAGAHAELWSALAVASYQDAASSTTSFNTPADSNDSDIMSPSQIFSIARAMIPTDEGPFQIQHTRALLLLSLVGLGRESPTSASMFTGMAVRILLGLEVQNALGDGSQQSQRLNAAFVACFIMDNIVSLRCGKPPHLRPEDMTGATHISENDLDEWQPWAACDGFGHGVSQSRQSLNRNPAYCRSTLNQLYDIFKVVGAGIASRRARAGHGHDPSMIPGPQELQQAVNLRAPFGAYLLSANVGSPTVPSPYILKIIYLWAKTSLDTVVGSTIDLIFGVAEQYQANFGACAAPPFLGTCLASLASRRDFRCLHQHEREGFMALQACLSSVWNATQPVQSTSRSRVVAHTATNAHTTRSTVGSLPPFPSASGSASQPSEFRPSYKLEVAGDVSSLAGTAWSDPGVFAFPRNPQELLSPTATVLTQGTSNDLESNAMAAQATSFNNLHKQYQMPSHPAHGSIVPAPVDCDALLDDLVSMDYIDGADSDPQFMTNLGFAPGCDLADIYAPEFTRF